MVGDALSAAAIREMVPTYLTLPDVICFTQANANLSKIIEDHGRFLLSSECLLSLVIFCPYRRVLWVGLWYVIVALTGYNRFFIWGQGILVYLIGLF